MRVLPLRALLPAVASLAPIAWLTVTLGGFPTTLGADVAHRADAYVILAGALLVAQLLALLLMLAGPLERSGLSTPPSKLTVRPAATGTTASDGRPGAGEGEGSLRDGSFGGVPALQLRWDCVSYSSPRRTRLLQPSSGEVHGGIWCMIGPSGAGKSTLLGVLAGRKATGVVEGKVYLNGCVSGARARRVLLGHVAQDDVLPGTSTPEELLHFHAALRLSWLPARRRPHLVDTMLGALRLEHLRARQIGDAYVRGLSGGERRRVSVAIELLVLSGGGSGMLLMDEPLTGLDSVSSRLLMDALYELVGEGDWGAWRRRLSSEAAVDAIRHTPNSSVASADITSELLPTATTGAPCTDSTDGMSSALLSRPAWAAMRHTVIMSVHQPNTRFMHNVSGVIAMGAGGRMLYCGPRRLADGGCALAAHFDGGGLCLSRLSHNPAEAVLEAMMDEELVARLDEIATRLMEVALSRREAAPAGARLAWRGLGRQASVKAQLLALCARQVREERIESRRRARLARRHPLLIAVNLVCTIVVGIVSGFLFFQLDDFLETGVLMKVGLTFFLGLYFTLTSLVNLSLWSQERLLYFQEYSAGCYGPFCYVLARTVFDVIVMRLLPTVACVAILYPMVGLSAGRSSSAVHAALFLAGLFLCNLVGTTVVNTFGVICGSSGVATLLSVFFALFSMLFCGFVVNLPALSKRGASWLRFGSSLFYLHELVMSDELIDQTVNVRVHLTKHTTEIQQVQGQEVLGQLGFSLNCSRIGCLPDTACWYTIYVPFGAVCTCILVSTLMLRFCVKDPH